MIVQNGKGVSAGVATGPIYFYAPAAAETMRTADCPAAEQRRLEQARQRAAEQLRLLAQTALKAASEEAAELFEAHALLALDEDFADCMNAALEREHCTAERAVACAREQFSALLGAADNAYMQARTADLDDVARCILQQLTDAPPPKIEPPCPSILAADDLSPAETLQLDPHKILGFLTRGGSANSHTAILARLLGIPAICGAGDALCAELNGQTACMDGGTGEWIAAPDAATRATFARRGAAQQAQRQAAEAVRGLPDETQDGRRLSIFCNIAAPEDVAAVLAGDAQGVGLFRSEFLYLAAERAPTEEEQFRAYRAAAAAMDGKRVVIRTFDLGADKQAAYLNLPREENPALGLRAVRVCFAQPELFRTQLRALYRASAYGDVAILFPMIASVWEVQECKRACRAVMAELEQEGVPYRRDTPLGVMIETPAAVLMAAELAKEADFFSVGTNDLTQYLLACDRHASHLERYADPYHPAVLRALQLTADAAHAAGIPVSICGELAADASLLETFLAIGIDALSVAPASVLPLRAALRGLRAEDRTRAMPQG